MNQITTPCSVCGRIADDIHHGRPHDLSQGVGMGGTDLDDAKHFHHVPLCRECHDGIHNKTMYVEIADDGSVTTIRESGVTVRDMRTDEELVDLWDQGCRMADGGLLLQAEVAVTMHDRYGAYGRGWRERVAEILRGSGRPCSGSLVQQRYWQGVALRCLREDGQQLLAHLGATVLAAAGQAADVPLALEQANEMRDGGMKQTEVAAAILQTSAKSPPCEDGGEHVCRWCKETWQ